MAHALADQKITRDLERFYVTRETNDEGYAQHTVRFGNAVPAAVLSNYSSIEQKRYAALFAAASAMLAALEAEQEWQARDLVGALDPEWDYETMVGAKRRAAIAQATQQEQA